MKRLSLAIALALCLAGAASAAEPGPSRWANPLIDSANSRWFFFSSACRPFGMVNLSPDTQPKGAWDSGYLYNETFIHGMSHVHAWQLSGVPVMPVTGEMTGPAGSKTYGSTFSHDTEVVRPGYHKAVLDKYGIEAELTSTARVGFHRYRFPPGKAYLLFDLGAPLGPSDMADAHAKKTGPAEISGYVVNAPTMRRPKPTPVFFVARLETPMASFGGWRRGKRRR